MKTLIKNLLLFDRLNEQQSTLVSQLIQEVHLEEGEYFIEPGSTFRQLAFVEIGVLRYNYYNRLAENLTTGLIGEGDYIGSSSFLHLPFIQSDYLQAITKCTLSVIPKSSLDELSLTVPNWDIILMKISQKTTAQRRSRMISLVGNTKPRITAAEYLAKFPNIGKHININQMLLYIDAQVNDQK
jgi:CRP-like cAMP-binding protein